MKTVIFDTEHFETAYALIRLFDVDENELTIFTNEHVRVILQQMLGEKYTRYDWVVQGKRESNFRFILRIHKLLKILRPGLFIYSTVRDNHLLHAWMLKKHPQMRSVLTLHAINCVTRHFPGLGIRPVVRNIGSKLLVRQADELNLLAATLRKHLDKKLRRKKPVHNLPGAVYERNAEEIQLAGTIRLVIPGSIDRERRDYDEVFRLLDLAEQGHVAVEAILLGAPVGEYGASIVARAKRRKGVYTAIQAYDTTHVPVEEFDRQMKVAHFVYIPVVRFSYAHDHIREVYGETKTSGNIFDAVRYARPVLHPTHLAVPDEMKNSSYRYEKAAELVSFFRDLGQQPAEYAAWQQRALESSMKFTPEAIREAHPTLFPIK